MIWRWIILIGCAYLISWSLLTPNLDRNVRFAGSFGGAVVFVIAIYPMLKPKDDH